MVENVTFILDKTVSQSKMTVKCKDENIMTKKSLIGDIITIIHICT